MEFGLFELSHEFSMLEQMLWFCDDDDSRYLTFNELFSDAKEEFVKRFEKMKKYCDEAEDVSSYNTITSQVGDTAMLFYIVKKPRHFMIAYSVKPEYLRYEQTFATCCKYFGAEEVLAVFNAYFDYLETKRE